MARVALFGGSFNPPHVGHQMVMLYALETARVERLLMVPCFVHAFEKALAPFAQRLEMCRLAADIFGGRVEVSDVEGRLGGESRTLHTVRALLDARPDDELVVVIGSDLLAERERWLGWEELRKLVDFFVVAREGHATVDDVVVPGISSTAVRARIAAGGDASRWLPAGVASFVAAHGLYR